MKDMTSTRDLETALIHALLMHSLGLLMTNSVGGGAVENVLDLMAVGDDRKVYLVFGFHKN